jgi:4-azaleucine resistance transporter AzlC
VRAELPLLLGVMPFGMIYSVLALDAGLTQAQAQGMSSIVFAGSAQFITTQLVKSATPGVIIVLTILVVNLRHTLYSASLAPHIQHLPLRWKLLLAYLLTDEAYAPTITHYEQTGSPVDKHWFFLGAGLALWTGWQMSTAAGILLGAVIPESWSLDFTLALTFIALVVPRLRDRPSLAAALMAGGVALAAYGLPYKLGILAAALCGIMAGTLLEGKK